jgi:hypothetical protein
MALLTKVLIDDVDCTSYVVKYDIDLTNGESVGINHMTLIRTVLDVVDVNTGSTVEIWRGLTTSTDVKVFWGYIEKVIPSTGVLEVTSKDKMWDLIRKEVNYVYEDGGITLGKKSEIFKDLVNRFGGLNCSDITVQDSGNEGVLTKFVCNRTDVFERCKILADSLTWQFYYRSDTDNVYLEPWGNVSTSTVLTVGSDIIRLPKWNYDIMEMVNDLTVAGAVQEVETTESGQIGVTAGYTSGYIQLINTPISVKVYGDASNPPTTLKTGGVSDVTTTYNYTVDKTLKRIVAYSGFTANHYYEIRYSTYIPNPVKLANQVSIDSYGRFTKTITYKDIKSVQDAESRAINYLAQFSVPFVYSTINVKQSSSINLRIGMKLRVIDSLSRPRVDSFLAINRMVMYYPGNYDELYVGDKEWRMAEWQAKTEKRIKRLEETEESSDIIFQINLAETNIDYKYMFEIEVDGVTTLKRDYRYYDYDDLNTGTPSANIDIFNGDIRLI